MSPVKSKRVRASGIPSRTRRERTGVGAAVSGYAVGMSLTITEALAARLIAAQFPEWAHLPIRRVEPGGWDNRTFRLGDDLSIRLPSAERYAPQVKKEYRWLPVLAPQLPVPVPVPLAMGVPGGGYPWHWSVLRWLPGESVRAANVGDIYQLAAAVAGFLNRLRQLDPIGGPPAGAHNFHRGGSLAVYDAATRKGIDTLRHRVDAKAALAVWEAALGSRWEGAPVWVHGDVSADNLLVREGRLSAVIDFGSLGVGDPACDLTFAWTFLPETARPTFRDALELDGATWARARGWALWKALVTIVEHGEPNNSKMAEAERVLDAVLVMDGRAS